MTKTIKRRRQEGKTDYKARLALLKSSEPRLIIRRTNRYVIAQFVQSKVAQDSIIFGANSKDLLEMGWPSEFAGSLKSRAAAYLTGLLLGSKAKSKIKSAILVISPPKPK